MISISLNFNSLKSKSTRILCSLLHFRKCLLVSIHLFFWKPPKSRWNFVKYVCMNSWNGNEKGGPRGARVWRLQGSFVSWTYFPVFILSHIKMMIFIISLFPLLLNTTASPRSAQNSFVHSQVLYSYTALKCSTLSLDKTSPVLLQNMITTAITGKKKSVIPSPRSYWEASARHWNVSNTWAHLDTTLNVRGWYSHYAKRNEFWEVKYCAKVLKTS